MWYTTDTKVPAKRHPSRVRSKAGLIAGLCMMLPWSSVAMAADPVKGRTYYAAHCANCHGVNGVNRIPGAPDFSRGESLLQPDNVLIAKIKAGKGMMPAYRGVVSDDEILDIIAHLRTLRR